MSLLDEFESYLRNRKSPLTSKSYIHTVEHYLLFLKGQEPSESNAEQFLTYMSLKGNGARSLNRHLAALKSFFKRILKKELNIESYSFEEKLPVWLDDEEQEKYWAACITPLEQALVLVFLKGGLRVHEAAELEIDNIDPRGYLKIMGKGRREEVVAIDAGTMKAINDYLALKTDHSNKVFPRGVRVIEKIIKRIGERARLNKKVTPHVLRHTAATSLLDKGFDIGEVRDQLRHRNIATTNIYIHTKPEKIRKKLNLLSNKL